MNHPLTDEICDSIAVCYPYNNRIDIEDCGHITDMRRAADWQLEADAEWWKIILTESKRLPPHAVEYIIEEFKQAMRPQEDNR